MTKYSTVDQCMKGELYAPFNWDKNTVTQTYTFCMAVTFELYIHHIWTVCPLGCCRRPVKFKTFSNSVVVRFHEKLTFVKF